MRLLQPTIPPAAPGYEKGGHRWTRIVYDGLPWVGLALPLQPAGDFPVRILDTSNFAASAPIGEKEPLLAKIWVAQFFTAHPPQL